MGGSWAGVLAVDDESAANILAGAGLEIAEARYNELKKKVRGQPTAPVSGPSRTPPQLPPQPIVVSAARAEDRIDSNSSMVVPGAPSFVSVTLGTTSKQPPADPLLEMPSQKRKKAA